MPKGPHRPRSRRYSEKGKELSGVFYIIVLLLGECARDDEHLFKPLGRPKRLAPRTAPFVLGKATPIKPNIHNATCCIMLHEFLLSCNTSATCCREYKHFLFSCNMLHQLQRLLWWWIWIYLIIVVHYKVACNSVACSVAEDIYATKVHHVCPALDSLFPISRPHTPASLLHYFIIHTLYTSIYIAIMNNHNE